MISPVKANSSFAWSAVPDMQVNTHVLSTYPLLANQYNVFAKNTMYPF